MKKLFALLTVIALSSAIAANAAESQLQNFVNKKLAPLTQKEQELNSKIEAQKKADAAKWAEWEKKQAEQEKAAKARRAEWEKKQAEQQKAVEAKKKEIAKQQAESQARRDATKKAIEAEKNYWKGLLNK